MMLLVAAVLLAGGGAAGYWWRDQDAKNNAKATQSEIDTLKSSLANAKKDLADAKADKKDSTACTGPSADELANIKDAIGSGNTAAVESYMQTSVNVILAASEAYGPQTPAQAVKDLDYVDSGTDPWNFELPAATISDYQKGDYKQYFPNGALVGKSANGYVVSFQFDSCGKIYGIFMSANADLL